jgi:hypothetical protein
MTDRQTDGSTNVFRFRRLPDVPDAKLDKRADTEDALTGDLDFSNVVVVAIEKYPAFLKKVFDKEAHAGNGENRDHHRYDRQAYNGLLRR